MISSTIGELADVRSTVARELEEQALAEGWLFEIHSTASGEPAESRYVEVARTCDLYVVIVAAQGSPATRAEYNAAFADNPTKILAFYLGDPSADTAELRSLIDSRHTRVQCRDADELPPRIVSAISDYIRSGEIVRYPLINELDDRLRRAEAVVRHVLPLCFIPVLRDAARLTDDDGLDHDSPEERLQATAAFSRTNHVVVEGIGGSGKSYAALALVRHVAQQGALPLILSPDNGHLDVSELISAELDAVRFYPGHDLLEEMARTGRLAFVVDGVDSLASDSRRLLLQELEDFARRFPRSRIVCCMRRSLPGELTSFRRFNLEPLSKPQTADMFASLGTEQIDSFPSQVADLARWPLWAWALLEVGPTAETGLVLLQRLLEHRVRVSGSYAPLETQLLLEAAAALAFRAWPEPTLDVADALDLLTLWRSSEPASSRYAAPPAAVIIERLSGAGVIQQARQLSIAHPLFATYLAAQEARLTQTFRDGMRDDGEFAMFVAALLPEDRSDEQVALLERHGPIGQARFLRLVPERSRTVGPTDSRLFGSTVEKLTGKAAECIAVENWTAWRESEHSGIGHPDSIGDWLSRGEVAFIQGNAFQLRTPVTLAAIEALARFKGRALKLRPAKDNWHDGLSDRELKQLRRLPSAELDEMLLQAAVDWRRQWRDVADAIRVGSLTELRIPDGEPQISLIVEWPDPRVRIEWGARAGVTRLPPTRENTRDYQPLSQFLGPGVAARVYRDVVDRTEKALGCTFGSQAWSRPEHVAAWAW